MKILFIDIETAPHKVYAWGLWNQDINPSNIIEPGYTLCFAAKFKDEKTVRFHAVWKDKREMLEEAHRLLCDADVVVHYNGTKFDIPHLNREFILAGMGPPSPVQEVDLLSVARRKMKFPSNKLDYVSQALGLEAKHSHKGLKLWHEVMDGDVKAQREMMRYNKQDVHMLEPLYESLLPWIDTHPNHGLFLDSEVPVCRNCGSTDLESRGYRYTSVSKFQRYQCHSCGKWSSSRVREKPALGVLK